jgi:septum formation inhibitor MinC
MKKVITLCVFVFAMFIGNQTLTAQNTKLEDKLEINAKASEKTETLERALKFDKNQKEQVYEAFKLFLNTELSLSRNENTLPAEIEKNEKRLETTMKEILNDEQFSKYKTLSEE